jgi:hypothetical protein
VNETRIDVYVQSPFWFHQRVGRSAAAVGALPV